jgi:SAM-dependent methyltransferase
VAEGADRFKYTTIAHHARTLLGPLSGASVGLILGRVTPLPAPGRRRAVLDVGCGKGEILLRAMAALGATGVGVDPNPTFASALTARAHARIAAGELVVHPVPFASAPMPRGAFDLVICTGASHAFGNEDPYRVLARLARPDGWAIFGTGYWRQPPGAEYLEVLGARADEMQTLEATLAAPAAAGWKRIDHWPSTLAEWDDYETAYRDGIQSWAAARPEDPDLPAFSARSAAWWDAYQRWGRDTLGFVTMVLRR